MAKISIKNYNRFDESIKDVSNSYTYYYNFLRQLTTSLFKWENLPNMIPQRFIEKALFSHGKLAFFDDKDFGLMITKCNPNSNFNVYDDVTSYNCFADNGFYRNIQADECVLIRNNIDSIPTEFYVNYFASKLYKIENGVDINISLQKFPVLAKCSESQRLTIKNLLMKFEGGEPFIFGNKDLDISDLQVLDMKVPFIADRLQEMKDKLMTQCLTTFGINNANTTKKERLNTDEVNSNNQFLDLSLDNMLLYRQIACKEINEKFKCNIEVSLREDRNKEYKEGVRVYE